MNQDFYSVLSLDRKAKPPEIKARFRELARERHPDRFQGADKDRAEQDFQDITEAFNVLMDPVRRRQHDLELDRPAQKAAHDPKEVVRVYLNRGIRAFKKHNLAEAAANFSRATEADPDNYQAWHHLALTCVREKRWLPRAQEAIVKACELRPGHVPYLKLAGKVFGRSGMTARAKQYYNQALREGGPDSTVTQSLKALEETPRQDQDREKPGLFRKIW
ncbi:MAG: DnaJ domain-containing protein [Acidobacteriota bacterium]